MHWKQKKPNKKEKYFSILQKIGKKRKKINNLSKQNENK